MLEKIFHSFALFFNNQKEIPYLRSAMQYLLCIQHALCEYPEKNILDTLRQVHCRSVVITNLQSSHTTAHNLLNYFSPEVTYSLQVVFRFVQKVRENSNTLRAHDCKYRESLARLKKNENSDNLSEKPLWWTIFEKNIFNFQESIVFEKTRKNENSGFYLINYAKIRVKMTYFIASVPRQDSKL